MGSRGILLLYKESKFNTDDFLSFPSYIGESADKTEAKDAEVPEHRKTTSKADV